MIDFILLAVFVLICLAGFFWRRAAAKKCAADATKKNRRAKTLATAVSILGAYLAATRVISMVFGPHPSEGFEVTLWAARTTVFGFDVSETVVNTWMVMAVLVVLALVLRFTVLRRLTEQPRGAQNALETIVEQLLSYMDSTVHGLGEVMGSYIFTIAALLSGCAVLEMFGLRTPASDIMFTLAMGLITFFLINWYGIRRKGALGRLKSLAEPTPVVFPIRLITDIAIPISLASRLFGNMLGGMVIMDLIYSALGNGALGIPSVVGLFFNVFHPLLQAFIFVTLSLTFIREAVE
ncbi:MAG: F0F1 ATP synthase subunit A [Oscillospiraceae bacterium]|jgi:F-type H+-transporting ATPase subunit a|nr:F0F1 ATP synthase subunit A [Oscillospiraceae bacterium]